MTFIADGRSEHYGPPTHSLAVSLALKEISEQPLQRLVGVVGWLISSERIDVKAISYRMLL